MADRAGRVGVDEVQWSGVFAWTKLFSTFSMAIGPAKMMLALMLVILLFLTGKVLDFMWGPQVYQGEINQYTARSVDEYAKWRENSGEQISTSLRRFLRSESLTSEQRDEIAKSSDRFARTRADIVTYYDQQLANMAKTAQSVEDDTQKQLADIKTREEAGTLTAEAATRQRERVEKSLEYTRDAHKRQMTNIRQRQKEDLDAVRLIQPRGVFEASSQFVLHAFDRGVLGAVSLNFGMGDFLSGGRQNSASVAGAINDIFVVLPGWLYRTHFWYMLLYALVAMVLWALVGGTITRMGALEATRGRQGSAGEAIDFTLKRFVWFILTPLFPLILCGLLSLVLLLAGLVFFNAREVWILDIAGGLLFGVAIVVGLLIAIILILFAGGGHLFYPALAVEGTDSFDAMSRAFGYLIARPWRWLFYTLVSMVYFAITYLFVGLVLFLGLSITQSVIRTWVFRETPQGDINRFDAMLPSPRLGHLVYDVQWSLLDTPGKIAAALIWVWVFVTVSLLAAYAISFYANVHVWIYLLLRKSVDGTGFDEAFVAQPAVITLEQDKAAQDKVEPTTPDAPASPSAPAATPGPDAPDAPDAPEAQSDVGPASDSSEPSR